MKQLKECIRLIGTKKIIYYYMKIPTSSEMGIFFLYYLLRFTYACCAMTKRVPMNQ